MSKTDNVMTTLALCALGSFSLFVFTSNALASSIHILLALPAIFYSYKKFEERDYRLSFSQLSLIFLILFALGSIIAAPDIANKFKTAFKLKYFFFGITGAIAFQALFDKTEEEKLQKWLKRFLLIFLIAVSVASLSGIIGALSGFNPLRFKPSGERASGMYGMVMTYGYGIQFVVLILVGMLLYYSEIREWTKRRVLLIALTLTSVGLVMSECRGAIIGLVLSLPFLFISRSKKLFLFLGLAGVILLGGVTSYIALSDGAGNRYFQKFDTRSNMLRVAQYQAAWHGFLERPFTGVGYRNFEKNSVPLKQKYGIIYPDWSGHAHNNFMEILADTGIFGFLSLLAFHFFCFLELLRRKDIFGRIGPAVVVALFVSGQFQNTITDAENMYLLMTLYALSQVRFKKESNS